ncbi:hypothetical protein V1264_009642 [Littorina saxatilis]|uniref:Reverse transcriptase domain-containing protein n=1 Tax=Littorina saxatilis TaxID=31220 RepID=A0AAN9ARV8_9CAEN
MAGGLARALSHWLTLVQSQWIVGVVRSGFRLLWLGDKAPLTRRPPAFKPPFSQEARAVLQSEVASLLEKGAVEAVSDHRSPGFYGRLFAVPKASGAWRPVLDLSFLNTFLRTIRFKMETPASVRDALRPGDWVTSIDLTDAYFHILVHPADRKWLRFRWASQVYQFRALPFGLSLAPWIFTMVVRQFCALVRSQGVRLRAYLDDWLIMGQSEALCRQHTLLVLREASLLGFSVNHTKSELVPSQSFTYLGMTFNTVTWTVQPSQKRVDKLQALIRSTSLLLRASLRTLASILGQMESMALLVPLGRVHKRPLQHALKPFVDSPCVDWNTLVPLGDWFQAATLPWLDSGWVCRGVPIVSPPPNMDLFTDASLLGWGAHTDRLTASGLWSVEQSTWHINSLELEAVFLALVAFLPSLAAKRVRLFTDNTTVAAYVNKQGGSRSPTLSRRTCEILTWCSQRGISLSARYLPGSLNTLADALSRSHEVLQAEWTITHGALLRLWAVAPKPVVDLFATRFSRRLPVFVSPFPDPEAWGTNALDIPWTGLEAYAFPPFQLLSQVLRKAELERPSLLLVTPLWPSQPWFPDLLRLTRGPPIPLALVPGELVQPRTGVPHGHPQSLNLHAWRL